MSVFSDAANFKSSYFDVLYNSLSIWSLDFWNVSKCISLILNFGQWNHFLYFLTLVLYRHQLCQQLSLIFETKLNKPQWFLLGTCVWRNLVVSEPPYNNQQLKILMNRSLNICRHYLFLLQIFCNKQVDQSESLTLVTYFWKIVLTTLHTFVVLLYIYIKITQDRWLF